MKRVWLVVSAVAFFCLQITTKLYAAGVLVAIPFLLWFAVKRPQLAEPRKMSLAGKALCALTAVGACLWPIENFAGWLSSITVFQKLQAIVGMEMTPLSHLAAIVCAVLAVPFVYHMLGLFYERFFVVAREALRDFSKAEGIAALACTVVLVAWVVILYLQTDAFASPTVVRDLIYTADSGAIVHENAYLSLSALENDFRSPLFAVFAMPLLGLPYLIGCILPFQNARAILLVAAQVPLLVASFWMLAKLVNGLAKPARILLPVVLLSTYSSLLFTVLAEQYVVALFYLSLGLYALVKHERREQMLLLGAAGTMLPGAALALLPERKGKPVKAVLTDLWHTALWGVALVCTLGCFGMVLRIPETLTSIGRFTGAGIRFSDKLTQFFGFVAQIFVAPLSGAELLENNYLKWRLLGTSPVLGIVLLLLACVGFVLNRRQRFARLGMAWVGVSFLVLCVLGWGTAENGLTLYTLYFGWAYAVLLVYLAESLLKTVRLERFSWIVYALCMAALLFYNLPRLRELMDFAITNYPI